MKDKTNKTEKANKLASAATLAIPFFTGAFVGGYLYMDFFASIEESSVNVVLFVLYILVMVNVSAFLHVIIHELGHLLFGLATGYRFSSFRIGKIMFVKSNGKIRLRKHKATGTGGQCLMAPPDMNNGKVPFVLYNLGGVLFDAFVSLACFAILLVSKPELIYIKAALEYFIFFGILLSLVNGIPINNTLMINDSGNVMLFRNNKKALRSFLCQLKIYEGMAEGKRLKDMPANWFAVPEGDEFKDAITCALGVFACNRLLDEKNFEAASELIDKLLDDDASTVFVHRDRLMCDKIFCELIGENNSEVIKKLLDKSQKKFMKSMKDTPSVIRTNYALALLYEKDEIKAEKIRNQFEKREKSYAYSADMQSERELIDIAKQQS